MRVFLFLILFCASLPSWHLLERVAVFSTPLQASCSALFSESFRHRELAQGFVCGTPIESAKDRDTFQRTGLIHLMVVSGGHLQLLALLLLLPFPGALRQKPFTKFGLNLALGFYCLATGFQPPVVRAFITRLFSATGFHFRWNWSLGKTQIASGLLALALFPEWIHSFSFYLSWLAALAFSLSPLCFRYRNRKARMLWLQALLTCLLIQAFISLPFGSFSLGAALINACLAIPLALVILVISLAPLIADPMIAPSDRIWDWLLVGLEKLLSALPPALDFDFSRLHWMLLWFFLLAIQVVLHAIHLQRYRGSHV